MTVSPAAPLSLSAQMPARDASPYRLRLEHEGMLSLRVRCAGRTLRFDPRYPPTDDDLVVLTWAWPEHLHATAAAFAAGACPHVLAPQPVLDWLVSQGAPADKLHSESLTVDGIGLRLQSYTPIPWASSDEALRKARSAITRPDRALRRLALKRGLPASQPQIVLVDLPDGGRLAHLNLSLHQNTPQDWLATLLPQLRGVDWVLLGADYGEQAAIERLLPTLDVGRIMLVDLLSQVRVALGMPTELLTPLCDRLRDQGIDAYVFPSNVSLRFES